MTDLSKWRGNLTGIPRTVYEIALRYSSSDATVAFFVYDEPTKGFFEIDFQGIIAAVTAPAQQSHQKPKESTIKKAGHALLVKPVNYYKNLPDQTKDRIPESVAYTAKQSIKIAEKIARTILHQVREAQARKQNRSLKRNTLAVDSSMDLFGSDDIVCVLGASWDSKTKMLQIAKLREEISFKYVQLIHDVIPCFNPHLYGDGFAADFDRRIFESIANADLLFCNSKTTHNELKRFCDIARIPLPPVALIRLGDDYAQSEHPVKPHCNLNEDEPFILSVATYEVRKNYLLLYYAAKEAIRRGVEIPKILIAGRPGWLVRDLSYILENDPEIKDKIQYLGGISDEEKTWLFQRCSFTIVPAMFEGWGLPVGESLYYQKPCLSSEASSMPEIGGDLVDYFSPYDSGQCLDKIIEYSNPETLALKTRRIIKEYQLHSWDETFRQVEKAIDKL